MWHEVCCQNQDFSLGTFIPPTAHGLPGEVPGAHQAQILLLAKREEGMEFCCLQTEIPAGRAKGEAWAPRVSISPDFTRRGLEGMAVMF